jgi:hypothetical protein
MQFRQSAFLLSWSTKSRLSRFGQTSRAFDGGSPCSVTGKLAYSWESLAIRDFRVGSQAAVKVSAEQRPVYRRQPT